MIKLGNDTEVAFTFSESPEGKVLCRVRVRSGSQNTTLEPDEAQFVDVLRALGNYRGVKMRSYAAAQTAPKCPHPHIDLASVSLADVAAAKREKLLAPIEDQAARIREEIERLEAWAGEDGGEGPLPVPNKPLPVAPVKQSPPVVAPRRRKGRTGAWGAVRDALASDPGRGWRADEVATVTGMDPKTCSRALVNLALRREIERVGRGVFRFRVAA